MALFENYERRIDQINKALNENGIASIEEAKAICDAAGIDVYNTVKGIQPICFEKTPLNQDILPTLGLHIRVCSL